MHSRPQVVAHRGSSELNPEHTLGAYLAAIAEGAEALECDVRLTRDQHLVCVHDRDLQRTAFSKSVISESTLADLASFDFSSWKHPWADLDDERNDPAPEQGVLTMRRLLQLVADCDRRPELAIETKHPTRFGGQTEHALAKLLAEFDWLGVNSPARVMSFSIFAVRRMQKLAPKLEQVYLIETPFAWQRAQTLLQPNWIAGPGIALVRQHPEFIRSLIKSGRRVHCWTVNSTKDIDLCLDLGIEAIITDRPGQTLKYLTRD